MYKAGDNFMSDFNPNRLKEARIYRKMTIEELAGYIGVKKQAVSQFENGKSEPEFETLNAISKHLNFPIRYFREGDSAFTKVGNTYFRALYSSNKKDLNSQRLKAYYVALIQHSLSEYIDFPLLNIPQFDHVGDMESLTMQVRDYWGLGEEPISDMVSVLERNGIIVSEFSTDGKKIDAFYQYGEIQGREYYCVVLGTDKLTFARRQFNAAHELAHILLHEKYDDLNEINREEFRQREDEANKFASALLLPKDAFIRDVKLYSNKLNYYVELKRKWKVSVAAMIVRAFDLEVINANQYQYLMRQLSKNGWRTGEPLDEYMIVKRPKAIKQAINLLILNGHLTPKQVLELFSRNGVSLPKDVIDEVLNLEPDILPSENDEEGSARIIQFPRIKEDL